VTTRPAFYALERGGWRDYVTLLHLPYTAWHLAYVAIGAALAPALHWNRLGWTLAAFALALGVAAHALDELHDRPLRTEIPDRVLVALAVVPLAAAVAIGIGAAAAWSWWLLAFVAAGGFLVPAYNLELPGFHSDLSFGLAWGGFPVLTAFFAQAERLEPEAVLAAAFAVALSLAQRRLSTQVRAIRRRGAPGDVAVPEAALRLLALAVCLLAASLLVLRDRL
jgi:hypothetical protein